MSQGAVAPNQKPTSLGRAAGRLLATMKPERLHLVAVVVLAVAGVVFQVLGPKLLGDATNVVVAGVVGGMLPAGTTHEEAVDTLREEGNDQLADALSSAPGVVPGEGLDLVELGGALGLAAGAFLIGAALLATQGVILNVVVQRIGLRLRNRVQAKIDRLSLATLDSGRRGDLISRVTNDIDNVTQSLQQTLSQAVMSICTIFGVLAMMVWMSWQLALIALIAVPLAVILSTVIAARSRKHFQETWRATGDVGGTVEESFTGHQVMAAFTAEDVKSQEFTAENRRLAGAFDRSQFIANVIMPALLFLMNINYILLAVVGGLRVASGQLSVGEVQAFLQYSRQFTQPLAQLGSMIGIVQSGAASAERVFNILDNEEEPPDPPDATDLDHVDGAVEFRDVSFRYETDVPLIDDLDLHVSPGQTVAIVGPTGAGKTTLVNLIMRFYEVDDGVILLDGVPTSDMSRDGLRQHIGMVLQDAWLADGSIADNIAAGRIDATRDEVESAGAAAGVERFVRSLPDGYDTELSDGGASVSAGERQLITIARAFLADRAVLILDEATSSVDTRTEVLVQEAMARLREGRTAFVIAHRLSTIRDADVILVMEDGDIVEQGSHEQLIAAQGPYYRLYQSQFSGAMLTEETESQQHP